MSQEAPHLNTESNRIDFEHIERELKDKYALTAGELETQQESPRENLHSISFDERAFFGRALDEIPELKNTYAQTGNARQCIEDKITSLSEKLAACSPAEHKHLESERAFWTRLKSEFFGESET